MTTSDYTSVDAGEKIRTIAGKITLVDGSEHEFSISTEGGRQSWGAAQSVLSLTAIELDAVVEYMHQEHILADNDDLELYDSDTEEES